MHSSELFDCKLTELIIADIVGHGRSTVAQTETGKSYLKLAKLSKLRGHVNLMPTIELPTFKYNKKWNYYFISVTCLTKLILF